MRRATFWWKLSLILLALGLTVALLMFGSQTMRIDFAGGVQEAMQQKSQSEQDAQQLQDTDTSDVQSTTMFQPRFSGVDKQNNQWQITASEATQKVSATGDLLELKDIAAEMNDASGGKIQIFGNSGSLNRGDKKLIMEDGVKASGFGMELKTERIESNLETNETFSTTPVEVKAGESEISADSFNIKQEGEIIRLEGGVRGRLITNPSKEK